MLVKQVLEAVESDHTLKELVCCLVQESCAYVFTRVQEWRRWLLVVIVDGLCQV